MSEHRAFKATAAESCKAMSRHEAWARWAKWLESLKGPVSSAPCTIPDEVKPKVSSDERGFDAVLGIMRLLAKEAKVFRFPVATDLEALDKSFHETGIENLAEVYVPPFSITGVESVHDTVVVLRHVKKTKDHLEISDEVGIDGKWIVYVTIPGLTFKDGRVRESFTHFAAIGIADADSQGINFGPRAIFADGPTVKRPELLYYLEATSVEDEALEAMTQTIADATSYAFSFLLAVQAPKNWIVEEAPVSPLKAKAKKRRKILPLSMRPVYVSLSTEGVRKRYNIVRPGGKRSGHERRAHLRKLNAERFTYKRGQTIPVKATWIGPSSGQTADGREYRVRLDIKSPGVEDGDL